MQATYRQLWLINVCESAPASELERAWKAELIRIITK